VAAEVCSLNATFFFLDANAGSGIRRQKIRRQDNVCRYRFMKSVFVFNKFFGENVPALVAENSPIFNR
jgi:hypothetical protein